MSESNLIRESDDGVSSPSSLNASQNVSATPSNYPTPEEMKTLRRVAGDMSWGAYLIAFVETCERFSYYGCTVVFTNYIQHSLPPGSVTGAGFDDQSGAMGLGQRTSTALTTFNAFWAYVMPLFGGYIADTYWGRYKTIFLALFVAIFGHILLVISAIPPIIVNPYTSLGIFIVAIIIMGIGTGGFKANISPLIAEQHEHTKPEVITLKSGERVILDPAVTAEKVYMYFYLVTNIGALVGQIGMTYCEKYVGFWLAFLLPTVMLSIAVPVVFFGRKRYITSPPQGSVLSRAFRLFVLATKGRWSINPAQTHRNMNDGTFWDKVKPSQIPLDKRPHWMNFDDQWVDQVARGFKACSVFLFLPLYWLTYNQLNNNLTSQAAVMKLNGLPNDVLSNLDPFALIILIPITEKFLYPALRRARINFSPIKKITLGFILGSFSMVWAAVIQHYIYQTSSCGTHASHKGCDPVELNVWAQTGAYILIAVSEIFAIITSLEYAFTKAPKNMRSVVMAFFLFMSALSSALGEAFVTLSEDPLLIWNYGVMAVLSMIGGIFFWASFRSLDAKEDELNNMEDSKMDKAATPGGVA